MSITDELKKMISEESLLDESDIKLKSNFADDLGFDRLDMVELIVDVEDHYGITITDKEFDRLQTVSQLRGMIRKKTGKV
jgi:acyl carrier protein